MILLVSLTFCHFCQVTDIMSLSCHPCEAITVALTLSPPHLPTFYICRRQSLLQCQHHWGTRRCRCSGADADVECGCGPTLHSHPPDNHICGRSYRCVCGLTVHYLVVCIRIRMCLPAFKVRWWGCLHVAVKHIYVTGWCHCSCGHSQMLLLLLSLLWLLRSCSWCRFSVRWL